MCEIKLKKCIHCGEEKEEINEFFQWIKSRNRFEAQCRVCKNERALKRYRKKNGYIEPIVKFSENGIKLKECTKCGKEKEETTDNFIYRERRNGYFEGRCRDCINELSRDNKKEIKELNKKQRENEKIKLRNAKEKTCVQCNKNKIKDYFAPKQFSLKSGRCRDCVSKNSKEQRIKYAEEIINQRNVLGEEFRKLCNGCGELKKENEYHPSQFIQQGSWCKNCSNNRERESRKNGQHLDLNAENLLEKQCKKCKIVKQKDEFSESQFSLKYSRCSLCVRKDLKDYRFRNKSKRREYQREYRKKHRDKINAGARKILKDKRENDFTYVFMSYVSQMVKKMLKTQKSYKKKSCRSFLPFSKKELIEHFEWWFKHPENLTPDGKIWMNWGNHGDYKIKNWDEQDPMTWKWHIEHIVAQSKLRFNDYDHPNFLKCWSLENLRPLRADINMQKGNR